MLTHHALLARRHWLAALVFGIGAALLVRIFVLEPVEIASGSMAPALLGPHRDYTCPRCGSCFAVGRHAPDGPGCYRNVACPTCGQHPLPRPGTMIGGARVLVNRVGFAVREPRRWEIVVLRLGSLFIKRLLGLPGETVLLRDGDLYVDGRLQRKSWAEIQAMRVLLFDDASRPDAPGRWGPDVPPGSSHLPLDGRGSAQTLTYRHHLLDEDKCAPITDEYSYNRGRHAGLELVHDFQFEADVCMRAGSGRLAFRLHDGQDWVEVSLPAGSGQARVRSWPDGGTPGAQAVCRPIATPQRACRVGMAFVDRRLSFVVDEKLLFSIDLPDPDERRGVAAPLQLEADGVAADIRNFRLYRDIHYSQRGENGVRGRPVRLGAGQYFVLGDNSPDSEDSRFWPDQGKVSADCLVGPLFPWGVRRPGLGSCSFR